MTDDPYSVLGVTRGTPVAEIKRAYRRLAKANHPDSAGPGALSRFLAIQAAYEELVEGKPRPRDPGGASGPSGRGGSGGGSGPSGPAWRADPERARATRESWRRRSSRPAGGSQGADTGPGRGGSGSASGSGGDRSGPTGDPSGASGSGRRARDAPPGGSGDGGPCRGGRSRSDANRATPGSTTYDGADREPFDPEWGGASWYGPSSGTYWTINPKEYADPRKHGPEYQARARRGMGGSTEWIDEVPGAGPVPADRAEPGAGTADPSNRPDSDDVAPERPKGDRPWPPPPPPRRARPDSARQPEGARRPGSARRPAGDAQGSRSDRRPSVDGREPGDGPARSDAPSETFPRTDASQRDDASRGDGADHHAPDLRSQWAAAGAGAASRGAAARAARASGPPPPPPPPRPSSAPTSSPSAFALPEWFDAFHSRGRILAALLAWPPVGLAAALIFGEVTGCARFSVGCADATTIWPWLIQIATIGAFLLAPALARLAVVGTFAILISATPLTLFLMTGGRAGSDIAGPILFGGLAIAWIVGVAIGLGRRRREVRPGSEGPPPVP